MSPQAHARVDEKHFEINESEYMKIHTFELRKKE